MTLINDNKTEATKIFANNAKVTLALVDSSHTFAAKRGDRDFMNQSFCRGEQIRRLHLVTRRGDDIIALFTENSFAALSMHLDDKLFVSFMRRGLGTWVDAALATPKGEEVIVHNVKTGSIKTFKHLSQGDWSCGRRAKMSDAQLRAQLNRIQCCTWRRQK